MNEHGISEAVYSLLSNNVKLQNYAIGTLLKIANNILNNPNEEKYRKISLKSNTVENILLPAIGALEVLFLMGFEEADDKLLLPTWAPLDIIREYKEELMKLKSLAAPQVQSSASMSAQQGPSISESEAKFKTMLSTQLESAMIYENFSLKNKALQVVPVKQLTDKAKLRLSTINKDLPDKQKPMDIQDCLLLELLDWFKNSFFTWFDTPACDSCNVAMVSSEPQVPTQDDLLMGADRVEGYVCQKCGSKARFPRYCNPGKLLESRTGRCGEWAGCFTLLCRALDMDTRHVLDVTDHVWVEVYSKSQCRWLHADPCENKLDSPLMYEHGWGKKLSYVIASSKDEIVDVTMRYSSKPKEITNRRKRCREEWLAKTLDELNKEKQSHFDEAKKMFLQKRLIAEIAEFFQTPRSLKAGETEGRTSGSLQWRVSRNEIGKEQVQSNIISLCPQEIQKRQLIIQYCPSTDSYRRPLGDDSLKTTNGWSSLVYTSKDIFRKVETDWNMVYLARNEGTKKGTVSWKFDWKNTKLKIESATIVFQHQLYNNGAVHWKVSAGDVSIPGNKEGVLELKDEPFGSSDNLEIMAELSGGEGDVAWQHAQLFRMSSKNTEIHPFTITINFKES